jgi:CheY-like chemotaxis protein
MTSNAFALIQVFLIALGILVAIGLVLYIAFGNSRRADKRTAESPQPADTPSSGTVHTAQADDLWDGLDGPSGTAVSAGTAPDDGLSPHASAADATGGFDAADVVFLQDAASRKPPETMAILVVDDSAVPRAKLRKLFERNGYEVVTANDGLQALEAMSTKKFAVIITDLEMPNMDGFALIAAIQGQLETEDIPVIAITGHEELQAQVQNLQGLYGIFKKPWVDLDLLKRVDVLASLKK